MYFQLQTLCILIRNNSIFLFPCGSAGKESAYNARDLGLIPGLGRFPGEGKGYPLQYSGLENSMDCITHEGRKESDTTKRLSFSRFSICFTSDLWVNLKTLTVDFFNIIKIRFLIFLLLLKSILTLEIKSLIFLLLLKSILTLETKSLMRKYHCFLYNIP